MPKISNVALSAAAVALTLGAVQLASGHDLVDRWQTGAEAPKHAVNRAAKSDRAAQPKGGAVSTRTVSLRLNDLAGTTVLLRIPTTIETGNAKPPVLLQQRRDRKPVIACEPMVSSLTEVAKLLQPGRCVT
jgi:hypothetical protein